MPDRIVIIDYGMGNLRSVLNAFRVLGADARVSANPSDLRDADRAVLPGVGSFGDAMRNLRERGWVSALETEVRTPRKPFLGLCLGMQLLARTGSEHGTHEGLGWLDGSVDRLPETDSTIRIPHIGWNTVRFSAGNRLFRGLGEAGVFYFVHSYAMKPGDPAVASGTCSHGVEFTASVEQENVFGTQFHPEKSQKIGLSVLRNFLQIES